MLRLASLVAVALLSWRSAGVRLAAVAGINVVEVGERVAVAREKKVGVVGDVVLLSLLWLLV